MQKKITAPKIIPIIGDPVAQVATPDLWNCDFTTNNINAICVPIHLKPEGLPAFVEWVRNAENVPGFLSTIPHKSTLPQLCDFRRPEVEVLGVANTVRKDKLGKLSCAMFDGVGMISAIKNVGADFKADSVLIIGAGAAGSAIAYEALQVGASRLVLKDNNHRVVGAVVEKLNALFPDRNIQSTETKMQRYDVIINASPMGSLPNDPLPCQLSLAAPDAIIADAVTEPEETNFLKCAKVGGLNTVSGRDMASAQALHMKVFLDLIN